MSLNTIDKNAVIISASGMSTGGRILHHMYHRLQRPNDTLLFVGYQAEGTRGRRILDGVQTTRIFGIVVPVKCHVKHLNGLSAHDDKRELLQWVGNFKSSPKMTFVIHGEEKSSMAFAQTLTGLMEWNNVIVPEYLESFDLFNNI